MGRGSSFSRHYGNLTESLGQPLIQVVQPPPLGLDAGLMAEGLTVREIAAATGRGESTIRSHVKHMFAKHGLSRQADLVRLVLALGGAPESRP